MDNWAGTLRSVLSFCMAFLFIPVVPDPAIGSDRAWYSPGKEGGGQEPVYKGMDYSSFYLTMKQVIPVMLSGGGGSIINISSIASIRWTGVPYASYYATKAAINQLTKTTAAEYARQQIRVNAVLPGLMKTPMVEKSLGLAAVYSGGDVEENGTAGEEPAGVSGGRARSGRWGRPAGPGATSGKDD